MKINISLTSSIGGCSSGESSKQQIDEVEETELRSAATCFSLTNVN